MTKRLNKTLNQKLKIGLLGGSFNPAHSGHLHISEIARKKLNLTQVWWLVSPQNPLKSKIGMADFSKRLRLCKELTAKNPKIRVLDIEMRLNTRFTADTLKALKQKYPNYEFYWLMGADNLVQFHKWKNWQKIIKLAHVHVFDRDTYFYKAITSIAFQRFKKAIKFHVIKLDYNSSTKLRNG